MTGWSIRMPDLRLPAEPGVAEYFADEAEIRDTWWQPQAGEFVLDIGAAIGSYTFAALQAGAKVIAVDPDRVALDKMYRVAELNGLLQGLVIFHAALFDEPFYPDAISAELAASAYAYLAPPPGSRFLTMDAVCAGLTRLDWVKIDVEGAELGVLRSGTETLRRFHPRLVIEDHTEVYPFVAAMDSRGQCHELLRGLGYEIIEVPWGPPPRTYWMCHA